MTKILSKEIAFNGRLRTCIDGASIGPNDFQVLKNLRYTDANVRGIGGMTKINSSALASTGIRNGFHFKKALPAESHVLAWTSDGKVWDNETAIPSAGAFDAAALFTDTAGGSTGRFANAPGGALAYANGKEACLWGGTEHRCAGFIDYPTTAQIFDYTDLIIDNQTGGGVATIHVLDANPVWSSTTYIGSIMPIDGFKITIGNAAVVASTMTVKYWDGNSWEAVAGLSDGTAAGGISLAQTGLVSFTTTAATAKPTHVEKVFIYWYQVTVAAAAVWSGVTISNVTVSIPFQTIKDIFDGEDRPCNSFLGYKGTQFYDFTSNVLENGFTSTGTTPDSSTYAQVGAYTTTSYLYAGFIERMAGLMLWFIDEKANASGTAVATVQYWDGDSWVELGAVDGTINGAYTFAKSGWITWTPPSRSLEFKRGDLGKGVGQTATMYFYRVAFSAALDADVKLYHVAGIAAPKDIGGYALPVLHQNRTVLVSQTDVKKNSILMSASETANVFNGLDSYEFSFGRDEAINAAAPLFLRFGSSVQDMLMLTKQGEIHLLEGNGTDSDPFRTRLLSSAIGCRAPLTMATVPVGDLGGGVRRQLAIWESQRGIEVFDGATLMDPLLSADISDKFDPLSSTYAGSSSNAGFYDAAMDEYHWCPVGAAEWVYSFKHKKWFEVVRGTAKSLYGGIPVMDTSGNSYVYGFLNTGYLERLENGTTFDGNGIAHTMRIGDMALPEGSIMEKSQVNWFRLVAKAKVVTDQNIAMVYYNDTQTASYGSKDISPARSGYRLITSVTQNKDIQSVFHGFQFSITTDDEVIGFEPLFLGIRYTVFPDQLA